MGPGRGKVIGAVKGRISPWGGQGFGLSRKRIKGGRVTLKEPDGQKKLEETIKKSASADLGQKCFFVENLLGGEGGGRGLKFWRQIVGAIGSGW